MAYYRKSKTLSHVISSSNHEKRDLVFASKNDGVEIARVEITSSHFSVIGEKEEFIHCLKERFKWRGIEKNEKVINHFAVQDKMGMDELTIEVKRIADANKLRMVSEERY